jgi:hypothetical protein
MTTHQHTRSEGECWISYQFCLAIGPSLIRYPTIYWAPAGKKDSPEKYEVSLHPLFTLSTAPLLQGGREVADFVDFLKRKATNPVVISGEDEEEEAGEKEKSKDKQEL